MKYGDSIERAHVNRARVSLWDWDGNLALEGIRRNIQSHGWRRHSWGWNPTYRVPIGLYPLHDSAVQLREGGEGELFIC